MPIVLKISPKEIFVTLIVVLFLEIFLFMYNWKPAITIFPYQNVEISSFSDKNEANGASSIHLNYSKKDINVSYTLRKGFDWPFAGIRLRLKKPLDLRDYDFIDITMSAKKDQHAMFSFWTAPVILKKDTTGERAHFYGVNIVSTKDTYRVPFSYFVTPQWWLAEENVELSQLPSNFMKEVTAIDIRSGYEEISGEQRSLTIKQVKVSRNHTLLYLKMSLLFIAGIFLLLIKVTAKAMSKKQVIIPLKDIVISPDTNNPIGKIISAIGESCDDPDLTLFKVAKLSGISELKVSQSIKKEFELNFKQYLNLVRMEIATTLLKNSDLSIKEISVKSGYKTNPHFFRVFRSFYDDSPMEYRKRYSQKQ